MICTIKNGIGKLDGSFSGVAENAILKFASELKSDMLFELEIDKTLMSFLVKKGLKEYTIPIGFEINTIVMSIKADSDLICTVDIA